MTRIHRRPQPGAERGAAFEQSRAAHQKKKPFKIVLEAVTQEKKKLHSILTYASNAPTGFGFIPAGHPDFTEWCKEQCRQRNLDVQIVSAKPKNKTHINPEKLSHHVHRVGHHFPLEIINLACNKFGYVYNEESGLRKAKARERINWIAQRVEDYSTRHSLHGRPTAEKETKEYIHGAVREMFDKIPEADLSSIVNHAFQEGTNRVGNAKELSLARRVQLAVVAHIRHVYTDYDKLLKSGGWAEARQKVESVSLAKLKEWRDEAGEQSNELEETFREIIVLDDDETSSDGDSFSTPSDREPSIEIVYNRATAQDLQPERYTDRQRVDTNDFRRMSRRTIFLQPYAPQRSTVVAGTSRISDQAIFSHDLLPQAQPRLPVEGLRLAQSRPVDSRVRPPVPLSISRSKEPLLREIGGQLYHLQPIEGSNGHSRAERDPQLRAVSRNRQEGYVPPLPRVSFDRPSLSRRNSEQDVVIPSVEHETVVPASPLQIGGAQRPFRVPNSLLQGYVEMQSPKRKAFPIPQDSRDMQDGWRVKPVYPEDKLHKRTYAHQSGSSQSVDVHGRPRIPSPQPIIDLTSSPHRAPTGGNRGHFVPVYPYPTFEAPNRIYVSKPSRRSPMRDVRGAYFEIPAAGPSHAYVSDHRSYERRASPAHEYVSLRHEGQRPQFEEGP